MRSLIQTFASHVQRSSVQDLANALHANTSPSLVWAAYSSLLVALANEPLPLQFHQQVLRQCSPPKQLLRRTLLRQLAAPRFHFSPPAFESRFQALIANIRALGLRPSLDDYNFILDQFASIGYYEGSLHVYQELKRVGHLPNHHTFGLCFQAIAHRLTLPVPKQNRDNAVAHMQSIFRIYMADMRQHRIPMTSVNLDLTLRILKETLDRDAFQSIMRWGYAIDLSNLDRVPLEYTDDPSNPVMPFPFTTAALNTTIDMLGRLGDVSKLVQAFEVLTQPLPQASQHFFNSFDSGEDDDFGISIDVSPSTRLPTPSASPNTTTYNLLLRHLCTHGHAIFARHYLVQARRLDRSTSWTLKHMVKHRYHNHKSFDDVPAPHFAISRQMLLPILGESNRDKNLGLMRWLSTQLPYFIRKQKQDLDFYLPIAREIQSRQLSDSPPSPPHKPSMPPPLFDLDVENPAPPEPPRLKTFNIDLHVQILQRNIAELDDFRERLEFVLGRTTQRVKERLGRRVWETKDVYLITEGKRMVLTKEQWKESVNFQPRRETYEDRSETLNGPNPRHRHMSTFAPRLVQQPSISIPPLPALYHRSLRP